ncbi:MAG: amidase family protein, partial [Chitinophagaceae bacterium]
MKQLVFLFLSVASLSLAAQNKQDSIKQIQNWGKWYDLQFTENEGDSMMSNLATFYNTYVAMHKTLPKNDMAFPFAFQPAPYGTKIPTDQKKITWTFPETYLPANRDELAFYSIPQLASLIKNKRISSVALTEFFIARLKKWGDTLESVITLTEALAMQEATQADAEIKKGLYRGPLHGIPYGLKDLFAVKGYKTTWGSTPYMNQTVDENSFVYTQLKKAGAVLCAKLSLGALAYDNRWFGGFTRNPWNLQQGSSGSSAGSASSVVAGLLPFTIGTE